MEPSRSRSPSLPVAKARKCVFGHSIRSSNWLPHHIPIFQIIPIIFQIMESPNMMGIFPNHILQPLAFIFQIIPIMYREFVDSRSAHHSLLSPTSAPSDPLFKDLKGFAFFSPRRMMVGWKKPGLMMQRYLGLMS